MIQNFIENAKTFQSFFYTYFALKHKRLAAHDFISQTIKKSLIKAVCFLLYKNKKISFRKCL
jgi:hypothetical protein